MGKKWKPMKKWKHREKPICGKNPFFKVSIFPFFKVSIFCTFQCFHFLTFSHVSIFSCFKVFFAIFSVSDSCGGFLCSDNIRCVVLMCFFICSSWLKPGSYIKSQHSPKNCHPCFFGNSSSRATCACRMGSNCSKEVKPAMKFGWLVTKSAASYIGILTIGFAALTFSGSEPAASYISQHVIFDSSYWKRNPDHVKTFLVETEEMAWYMSDYGASEEQCKDPYQQEHLCCVACEHATIKNGGKMHAVSPILFLPQILPRRYRHLARFAWVLRQHSVLGKVVDKLYGCASRQGKVSHDNLAVHIAPCFDLGCAAPPEKGNEIEATEKGDDDSDDDDDELCIVCAHGKRKWKWGGCTHKADGPSLICLQCRGALLRAERASQNITDNRRWVETKCIICNQRSGFQRCNPRREVERPAGFVISNIY